MDKQKADGAAQEVQDAGSLHADGEESEQHRQHHEEHPSPIGKRQDREQKANADNSHVPQLPQPQLGLCPQVVRINIDGKRLPY